MNGDRSIDRPKRIPHGYTVCLIAVVAFLISINGVVDAWRRLVGSGLTMLIAVGLFAWHWSGLRARMAEGRAAAGRGA